MPTITRDRCKALFDAHPVAVLATVGPGGPHLVPVVFAISHDRISTAIDHKPKRTLELRRLANIDHNSRVSLLVQSYDEDWSQLWWVRADGDAIVTEAGEDWHEATAALSARYVQYRERPPEGPAIVATVSQWSGWEFTAGQAGTPPA